MAVVEEEEETEECAQLEDAQDEEEVQPLPVVEVTFPFTYPNPYPKGVHYKWCDYCDTKFRTEDGLRNHMQVKHNKYRNKASREIANESLPPLQCSLCDFKVKIGSVKYPPGAMQHHMRKKHKEEEAQRQEAKRARLRLLREEELQKAKAGVILCRSCDFQANPLGWRASMKKHMKEEHDNQAELLIIQFSDEADGGKYSCRLCSRKQSLRP